MRRARHCQFCSDPISAERRIDAKYCRDSCKTLAYQKRKGTRLHARPEPPPRALSELVRRLESQEAAARSELAAVRSELAAARSELVVARGELVAVSRELAAARSELAALRQRNAELEAALTQSEQAHRSYQQSPSPQPALSGAGCPTQAADPVSARQVPEWTLVPEPDGPSIDRIVDWVLAEHLPAYLTEKRPELARLLAQLSSQWRAILQVIGQTLAQVMSCQRVDDRDASGASLTQVAIESLPQLRVGLHEKAPRYAAELDRWFAEHAQLLVVLAEQLAWALLRRPVELPPRCG